MYQPQVSLHTFEAVTQEALLSWRKPDGTIATATEFIQAAEKTGVLYVEDFRILGDPVVSEVFNNADDEQRAKPGAAQKPKVVREVFYHG